MKVLVFTHSQDIDGIGCAILAKKAFNDCDIVPTKTFDITSNVKKYIDNKVIYNYDKIYVTDLCIKEPVLTLVNNDSELRNKLLVLDHHKSEIDEGNDKYDFANIIVEKDGIRESGTSLFYKYLLENNFLEDTPVLNELTEWTRQYDVWDWKKENNYNAKKLHILFETLGYDKYFELIYAKLDNNQNIEFTDYENQVVTNFEKQFTNDILGFLEKIKVVEIKIDQEKYKIGYIRCPYKYRNDINEFIISTGNKYDIDAVGMIMTDIDTVSYRQIKDYDLSKIAQYFGGKGHRAAASNPQNNELFEKMLKENNIL